MKTIGTIFKPVVAMVAVMVMASCSEDVDKLTGSWISGETRLQLDEANLADCRTTSRLTFTPDKNDSRSGKIDIVTDVVIDDALPQVDSLTAPYEITVVGQATISGKYEWAKDEDDEIVVSLDNSTLRIVVDPEGVQLVSHALTQTETPEVVQLNQTALAGFYQRQVKRAIHAVYDRYTKIEDMKFEKTIMSCEIGNQDYIFRRVGLTSAE